MTASLHVRDDAGNEYDLPITDGTIKAADLKQIRIDDLPLATYDPGFVNTASCRSSVTFIDGDVGILEYRGYPIEQLAEQCSFLEVSYLLINGELPTQDQLDAWTADVNGHRAVNERIKKIIDGFDVDAHPMSVLNACVSALFTFYPDSRNIQDADVRALSIKRLLAKMPTLAAFAHRHAKGLPYVEPDENLGYVENFLTMLFQTEAGDYAPDERLVKALDILLTLHADHEQNCSANAVRSVGSADNDPYTSVSAGIGALFGPRHGGANQAVLEMIDRIGDIENVPSFIEGVKEGKEKLMGFGHRVYKNYDPRAKIIKQATEDVFEVTGVNPKLKIAKELEKIALEDDYFVSRKLYPNVDFYSGLIYEAFDFPPAMFTVLFAVGRTPGWLAQWQELIVDPDNKIARPKQIYTGPRTVDVPEISAR